MTVSRTFVRGTVEYLDVSISCDFTLDGQDVEFSFDRTTWITATWQGPPGDTRIARILLDDSNSPSERNAPLYVRITDSPEIPILFAGSIGFRA